MKKFKFTLLMTFLPFLTMAQTKKYTQKQAYNKIVKAGIKHPKIVLKQAIIESNHFRHGRAKEQNNYLGLMNNKGRLRYFKSFEECLVFYKDRVQNRFKGGDYFKFLTRIGYAEDVKYNQKVRDVQLDFIIE